MVVWRHSGMIHNINLKASPSTEMARNTLYENYFQVYSLSPYYIFPQTISVHSVRHHDLPTPYVYKF